MSQGKKILLIVAIFAVMAGLGFYLPKMFMPAKSANVQIIELNSSGANPDTIAVPKGTSVEFDTKDGKSHDIGQDKAHSSPSSSSRPAFNDSGVFGAGSGYRVVFNLPGTYQFIDHLNPKIKITVVVFQPKH